MSEQKEVKNQEIKEYGQMELADNRQQHKLHLLSIIGEVEGHECLSANTKTTKYEHVLPKLAQVEDDREIDGLLVLLNTVGGIVGIGRKPFYRCAAGSCCGLLFYRSYRNHGNPSCAYERYRDRSTTDI